MSTATVDVETRGAVAIVTLNRPAQSNTLSLQMGMDLLAAAMTCARSTAVRAVVLTGAGQNFCFGGDLRGMTNKGGAEAYLRELTSYLHAAISLFVRMDPPVIAAIRGAVIRNLDELCDIPIDELVAQRQRRYREAGG